VDDHALRADAGLARILDARLDALLHRLVQIGGRHDDERVRAAEFKHNFFEIAPGLFGDRDARTLAPCERHRDNPVIRDDIGDHAGFDRQILEQPLRPAGGQHHLLHKPSDALYNAGVFE
jgi:hypothetical protein